MYFVILLSVLACVTAGSLVPSPTAGLQRNDRFQPFQRIVGGVPATIDELPFMTNLQYQWSASVWTLTCGGSLVTTKTILSAAHCFSDTELGLHIPELWRARIGSSYTSSGGTIYNIDRFILHEEFDIPTPSNNDVAIVVLTDTVVLSASVGIARVAGPQYYLPEGTSLTTAGWGRLIWGGAFPEQLQKVDIDVVNLDLCIERHAFLQAIPAYSHFPIVTDTMFCAGHLNALGLDSCSGDSGGPVLHGGNIIYGIVSWAYGCGDPWYPGVNVLVPSLVEWIVRNASWQ